MDFLDLEKGPATKETKVRSGTLVRPIPSLPKINNKSYGSQSLSTYLGNGSISLKQLSVHAKTNSSCPQAAAVLKTRGLPLPEGGKESVSVAGGAPQKQSATVERPFLDKPLEELTDGDILQLTREDCRRYLKEKGMRRPSWNKFQAIQQVLSLKGLLDSTTPNEKEVHREDSSTSRDCAEAVSDDAIPPLLRTESIGLQDKVNMHSLLCLATQRHHSCGSRLLEMLFHLLLYVFHSVYYLFDEDSLPNVLDCCVYYLLIRIHFQTF
ncbi:hypothetical protein O6H91_19G052000 [Diphasiastrum complanatum]|uniref:Uncharacterized protein n=1 Tax=Diphasiastrum complanatum TaxID=34168 RepID=A0ACC2AVZ7_DIPCM|nr:hypothetical protein O6H91_19G052000 [Diphasiastrum complanatum]